MANFLQLAAIVVLSCLSADAGKLPSYITKCPLDGPDLNACAKKNGQAALASVIKGDKDYKIPVLSPLKIDHITVGTSKNLNINIDDVEIFGLEDSIINDVSINLEDKNLKLTINIPLATIIGTYDIDGKILILPITGNGPCNITSVNGNYTYSMKFVLQKNKKGVEYVKIIENDIAYETERAYFHLENLFNGDKVLGPPMTKFLDENWREVNEELGPTISNTISQIITVILTGLFDKVSYKNVFS